MGLFYESRAEKSEYERVEGLDFPLHLHKEAEFVTVLSGEIRLTREGESALMHKGDCALIPPNCIHGYEKTTGSSTLVFFFGEGFSEEGSSVLSRMTERAVFPRGELDEYGRAALGLIERRSETRRNYSGVDRGLMIALLASVAENVPLVERKAGGGIVEQALCYIDERYTEQISESTLARELGVSRYYISHVFSEVVHVSFRDYVNIRRIERARAMLAGGTAPVTEIAFEAGFSCIRTFNRAFLSVCGVSPLEYRRQMKQQFLSDK